MMISVLFCTVAHAENRTYTLDDCFKLALVRSATVVTSTDQIDQTDAQIKQARAGYMPSLSLQAASLQQAQSMNALANNLFSTNQATANINLSQNLFQGFKDLATVKQRKNLKEGYEWEKKQALRQLYKDTAQAFYSVLIYQSDIVQYQEQIESTKIRKSELATAIKSGRAREADFVAAESSIANLEASVSATAGLLVTYQETLTYLTGLSSDAKLMDSTPLPSDLKNLALWLEYSEQRPDIRQSKSNLLAAEEGVQIAKSGFYPNLGLSANYYVFRPTGIYQGVDWDTSLTLSFPLFSGGLTKAQVNEASVIQRSKEVTLRQTRELAVQSVRTAFRTVQADFDQLKRYSKASDLSRRNYELLHRDNRLGVATNIDVLTALTSWQESKRKLERTRIMTIYDYFRLLVESSKIAVDSQEDTGGTK